MAVQGMPTDALMTLVMLSACLRPCGAWNLNAEDVVPPCPPLSLAPALDPRPEERGGASKTVATDESILLDLPRHGYLGLGIVRLALARESGRLF
eukprot:7865687-Pyramimonas_sp.AAC.1